MHYFVRSWNRLTRLTTMLSLAFTFALPVAAIAQDTTDDDSTLIFPASPLKFVGLDWTADHGRDLYLSGSAREDVVTDLVNTGSNTIKLDMHYYLNRQTMEIVSSDGNIPAMPAEKLVSAGNYFKERGFSVVLHLYIGTLNDAGTDRGPAMFMNDIDNPDAFFNSYIPLLKNVSSIAQSMQADVFAIGSEFGIITSDHRENWQAAIESARSNFDGAITYGANLNDAISQGLSIESARAEGVPYRFAIEALQLSFGDLLDYMGLDHYGGGRPVDPETGIGYDGVVSLERALDSWDNIENHGFSNIKILREISDFYGKQILFVEGAFSPMSPSKGWGRDYDPVNDGGDYVTYSNYYEAEFFQIYTALGDIFAGVIHGSTFPRETYIGHRHLVEHRPTLSIFEGTPTESVVKYWASGDALKEDLEITLSVNSPFAFGYSGDDKFRISSLNGLISGGQGIDTVIVPFSKDRVSVSVSQDGGLSLSISTSDESSDAILSVVSAERVDFSDTSIAYDLDGSAGQVAKILGAVGGQSFVSMPEFVKGGLELFDSGLNYEAVAGIALNAVLGDSHTSEAVVSFLYTNLFGAPPDETTLSTLVDMLDSGSLTEVQLIVLAADSDVNKTNINWSTLVETGLVYKQ